MDPLLGSPIALDVIRIEGLRVDCVVGIYPEERTRLQPLVVDLSLGLDSRAAGRERKLGLSIDYSSVAEQVAFVLERGRFEMLETAAHLLARLLLAPATENEDGAAVQELRLRITKPQALGGVGVPSLEVYRRAQDQKTPRLVRDHGWVEILDDASEEAEMSGLNRLGVAPGARVVVAKEDPANLLPLGFKLRPVDGVHTNDTGRWQVLLQVRPS